MAEFKKTELKKLWMPSDRTAKFAGGQITIVGGSQLFHGAPVLALKAASRIVSMVYFSTPEVDKAMAEKLKSSLASFIWVPREELGHYLRKSEAALIGPGMMRNGKEKDGFACDGQGKETRELTLEVLRKFPRVKWVIDGGALQVVRAAEIPEGSVVTPNEKEYRMLFGDKDLVEAAKEYKITILEKGAVSRVTDGDRLETVSGGNAGLIRGGTGDVLAGLLVGFLAKNEAILAAAAASYLVKEAATRLARRFGLMFNADDLADEVRAVYGEGL